MTWLVVLTLAATPTLEQQASSLVRERFETSGRSPPVDDVRLGLAARSLAKLALEQSASDAAGLLAVTGAVSATGGWDASPTAILIKASPGQLMDELGRLQSLATDPAQALGVGFAEKDQRGAICILLTQRKFELEPLPRHFKKAPGELEVCGALTEPLETAELFVTQPSGAVVRLPMKPKAKHGLCGSFRPSDGRNVVEVLGRGPKGPEVAALFFVDVGQAVATADQHVVEPTTPTEARRAVLSRVNGLRRTMGLGTLASDKALDAIAQAYADRMATEGFFAHVDPQGGDLKSRLVAGKYKFTAAGENLGASTGPLAAHFGIEHSPGHRLNLLEAHHRAIGIGLATRAEDGLSVLVEVLAAPLDDGGADPIGAAYTALDELRAKRGLKPLKRNPVLEALAQEHARRCLARDALKSDLPDGRKLHDKVFEAMADAREASVDLAVVEAPSLLPVSKNLSSPTYTSVGLGLVRGDSEKYGADKLWLVVIYANQAPEN
ncbi:MAG: CAP domain-containing protein [Archangiaceae bacterium]|nr:CAP domain-containing protein [Archangiaceae bacterium]